MDLRQQPVAALHLRYRPSESIGSLLRLHHDRGLEVRNVRIDPQLDPLRVDQDELDLIASRLVQDRSQHPLQADALAGAGGARNQQVRHLRQIGVVRLAAQGPPQRHGQGRRVRPELGSVQQATQRDDRSPRIRHFDAERGAALHAIDPDRFRLQRERQVVLQVDDLGDLDPRRRLELEDGDHRAGADPLDRSLNTELRAAGTDQLAELADLILVDFRADFLAVQQIDRRQLCAVGRLCARAVGRLGRQGCRRMHLRRRQGRRRFLRPY